MKLVVWVVVIVIHLFLSMISGFWLVWFTRLPGTIAHEACHWLVAWVLGANPSNFNLVPAHTATGYLLGSVTFSASWWNVAPIAIAPLILFPVIVTGVTLVSRLSVLKALAGCYVLATFLPAAIPSSVDLGLALRALGSWPLGLLLGIAVYFSLRLWYNVFTVSNGDR